MKSSILVSRAEHPTEEDLLERILSRENLVRALRKVERNTGSPGVDGMTVKELRPYLKIHWPSIHESLICGTDRPLSR
jgi:retron-type reverse transcriptase